jgi:hypothetical protein
MIVQYSLFIYKTDRDSIIMLGRFYRIRDKLYSDREDVIDMSCIIRSIVNRHVVWIEW